MLLAAIEQRPPRNPDSLADFRNVERFVRVLLHHPAKATHNDRVLPSRRALLALLAISEAADHNLDQRLLEPACGSRVGDYFRSRFCQLPRRRVEPLEPPYCGRRGSEDQSVAG